MAKNYFKGLTHFNFKKYNFPGNVKMKGILDQGSQT